MSFRASGAPIASPVAKLGGQPFWLDEPFWPVSGSSGEPMTFVGQFPLPGTGSGMAFLFVSDDDEGTFLMDGGENALLVQPGGRVPPFVRGEARRTGPGLWRRGKDWDQRVPVELHVDVRVPDERAVSAFERRIAAQDGERRGTPFDGDRESPDVDCHSYVGGEPLFWQRWTTEEIGESWRFFFQLDGADGWDDAYKLNFGGGTGYAFLSPDQREGRFLWDCV
jgi:hypothetical protein